MTYFSLCVYSAEIITVNASFINICKQKVDLPQYYACMIVITLKMVAGIIRGFFVFVQFQ